MVRTVKLLVVQEPFFGRLEKLFDVSFLVQERSLYINDNVA